MAAMRAIAPPKSAFDKLPKGTVEELRAVAHLGAARNLVSALLSTVATVDRAGLPKPAPDLHQTPDIEIFDVRAATPQDVAALLT